MKFLDKETQSKLLITIPERISELKMELTLPENEGRKSSIHRAIQDNERFYQLVNRDGVFILGMKE